MPALAPPVEQAPYVTAVPKPTPPSIDDLLRDLAALVVQAETSATARHAGSTPSARAAKAKDAFYAALADAVKRATAWRHAETNPLEGNAAKDELRRQFYDVYRQAVDAAHAWAQTARPSDGATWSDLNGWRDRLREIARTTQAIRDTAVEPVNDADLDTTWEDA